MVIKLIELMCLVMVNVEVDDDVLGNDLMVVILEREVVEIVGKEVVMFVLLGIMGNLISVLVYCDERGSEVIFGDDFYIYIYENGGVFSFGGVYFRMVKNEEDGMMEISFIEVVVRSFKGDFYYLVIKFICFENI